jgi:hypothetical protein
MGKIDTGLFEYIAAGEYATTAAAALVTLPLIDQKVPLAILLAEFTADAVLQTQQIALDGFYLHAVVIRAIIDGAAL